VAASFETSMRVEIRSQAGGAGLAMVIGLLVLVGYGFGFEPLWRPVSGLPGTHPITAICLLLLGLGSWPKRNAAVAWRVLPQLAIGLVVLLAASCLSDHAVDTQIIRSITPFQDVLSAQAAAGRPVQFAANSALALLGLGLTALLVMYGRIRTAQLILFCSAALLMTALIGFLDGLDRFHDFMGPLTLLACAGLGVSLVASASSSGFLAAVRQNSEPGRLARMLLLSSTVIILAIGALVARSVSPADDPILTYQTVALLALTWVIVVASTIRADTIDRLRREADTKLIQDANTDGLTGLLSRNRLDKMLAEPRSSTTRTAMLTIDVDRFRSANNALGTALGDALLVQTAKRLSAVASHHKVARSGGDEFVIFCESIDATAALRLAEAVVATMAVPFELDGRQFRVTSSVGVAHGGNSGAADLRDAADEAMFIAKQQGGNQAVPFVKSLHEARMERVRLEQDLHRAMRCEGELTLVYQPIISLRDRSIVSLEVLSRWVHPVLGAIPPSRFIAIAEDSGLFLELGRKMREMAVRQAATWHAKQNDFLPVINLNVSPLELARSDVPGELTAAIERFGLQTSGFCLEVTEGSFSDERALEGLQDARRRGFRIAMDDFGVGYSSLAQLPRLPLSSVKLDRSFLTRATENDDGLSLLATMVQLSHVLKLPVVAEGVETLKELDIVSACGCDSVQGFIFSHPLTAAELEPFLMGNRPWPIEQPVSVAS
jgi:diguanylate cyclase (GGDEF)-like protein